MTPAHTEPGAGTGLLIVVVLAATAAGYLVLVAGQRAKGRRWSRWRTASLLAALGTLVIAVVPPVAGHSFPAHMLQHLLIGMYAPLLLVLAAPVTLLVGSLPTDRARRLTSLLRSRPAAVLANPVTALTLNVGGLAVLYFTPLYQATTHSALLHHLVQLHFLAAGYLFAWVIAGPDPAPHRPSVPSRLVLLGVAIAAHAVLAQLIYAGVLVHLPVPDEQRRAGGDLMYYGGDTAELLLALALLTTWRPTHRRPVRAPSSPPLTAGPGGMTTDRVNALSAAGRSGRAE